MDEGAHARAALWYESRAFVVSLEQPSLSVSSSKSSSDAVGIRQRTSQFVNLPPLSYTNDSESTMAGGMHASSQTTSLT